MSDELVRRLSDGASGVIKYYASLFQEQVKINEKLKADLAAERARTTELREALVKVRGWLNEDDQIAFVRAVLKEAGGGGE
jgi:hypothetical protein